MPRRTDLWIVGVGIRGLDQITLETLEVLKRCRKVLHLTHQHKRFKKINPNIVDLEEFYWTGEEDWKIHDRILKLVLEEVERGPEVAVVSYGHPMVFDDSTLDLVKISKQKGFSCRVLPAISCLDTLCIDLGIDYGAGLQLFEATQLVEDEIPVNPEVDTLLMQLGHFGTSIVEDDVDNPPGRFTPLVEYLTRFYDPDHRVVIAFSNDGNISQPELLRTKLARLDSHRRRIFPGVTLYIPACE